MSVGFGVGGVVVGEDVTGNSVSPIKTRAVVVVAVAVAVGVRVGADVVGILSDMLRSVDLCSIESALSSRGTPMKGSKLSVSLVEPPLK